MSDDETIRVYDAKAADYAGLTGRDSADATLQRFIDALPAGAMVLDLGCGPGGSARFMARKGLRVEAWDASGEMVALAAALPGVAARQAVFDDLDAVDRYDGIWANFSLLHAPRADIPRHLAAIARALKPGALFHIGVKAGTGEKRDALGRLYTYFSEDELRRLLADAGLTCGTFSHGEEAGLDGVVAPYLTVSARA